MNGRRDVLRSLIADLMRDNPQEPGESLCEYMARICGLAMEAVR